MVADASSPSAPADAVAETSRGPATQPMPVWTIGYSIPNNSQIGVRRAAWRGARRGVSGTAQRTHLPPDCSTPTRSRRTAEPRHGPYAQAMELTTFEGLDAVKAAVGTELGPSDWLEITQERINTFAEATGDNQWIHV